MTDAEQLNPPAAVGLEIAVAACGLWLLWRLVLSPKAARAEARLPEWPIPGIDFACYAFFAIAGCLALSAAAGVLFRHVRISNDAMTVLGSVAQDGGFLLGIFGFYLFYRKVTRAPPVRFSVSAAVKTGAATFFIAMLFVELSGIIWTFVLTQLGIPIENQEIVDVAQNTNSAVIRVSLMAIAMILVPVTEELVFRGGLFRYFRTRMPRWVAIVLTSLLFGALHVSWSTFAGLPSLVPITVLAVVFCLAYERTGSLGTIVVAHALFNCYTFVLVAAGLRS